MQVTSSPFLDVQRLIVGRFDATTARYGIASAAHLRSSNAYHCGDVVPSLARRLLDVMHEGTRSFVDAMIRIVNQTVARQSPPRREAAPASNACALRQLIVGRAVVGTDDLAVGGR